MDRVDFVKMDIEGAEIEALKGMKGVLRNSRPHLAVASYHVVEGSRTSGRVERILKGLGYRTVTTKGEDAVTYAWKR